MTDCTILSEPVSGTARHWKLAFGNAVRMAKASVPEAFQTYRTKPEIAIKEIDRAIAAGVRFGYVLADAGYGLSASFRQALGA